MDTCHTLNSIGQLDGVLLESTIDGLGMNVFLIFDNKRIKIITDYATFCSHHITRSGLADILEQELPKGEMLKIS